LLNNVETLVRKGAKVALGYEVGENAMVFSCRPEFGDYQCNIALKLAKEYNKSPRDVAEKIMSGISLAASEAKTDMFRGMDISGVGFVNIRISSKYMKHKLYSMLQGNGSSAISRLGISIAENPQRVVVDFSSPNIAKEMHVVRFCTV